MGLAVVQNGTPAKASKHLNAANASERKTSRKGWTLFILKHNESCEPENSPFEEPLKLKQANNNNNNNNNYARQARGNEKVSKSPPVKNCTTVEDCSPNKERIRSLAAIVQDVLSRSRSDLLREYGRKPVDQEEHLTAHVVGFETGLVVGNNKDSSPEMSLSFRMRLVDRCDTDLGVVASLRSGSTSSIACESSQSCRFPLQGPGDGKSIVDLLERGKRLGIEDNSRVVTKRSSTTDEYECVVKRLRDVRGTIRLLAATAVREATRNSAQAREDLWKAGAIPPLVNLLQEDDMGICYMATVALLNLAIGSPRNKQDIADCGAIPILVGFMRPDSTTSVRESATTVILSLAAADQLKPYIGTSGAIIYLSDILVNGTTQGRSDSVRALLNLSIFKGNRPVIVQAGVISPLYKVILRDAKETAEKAVILLSHLFHDREGRETVIAEEHSCSVLLQVLKRDGFSQTCKEQTVVILLALSAKMTVRREAVFAQGILPSLVEIALIGSSPKIQEKAAKLLKIIKEQRTDEGILSMDRMDRVSIHDLDLLPLERQYSSSSTMDTSITVPSARRRSARSASSVSEKEAQMTVREIKEAKNLSYFRSLFHKSLRSEYLTCRAVSIDDSSGVPTKFIRSLCSQG